MSVTISLFINQALSRELNKGDILQMRKKKDILIN